MPIKIKCDICGEELLELGALLFSPPNKNKLCNKYHICNNCFKDIKKIYKNFKVENEEHR